MMNFSVSQTLAQSPSPEISTQKINLLGLDRKSLSQFFVEWGEKPFRANQVFKWIQGEGLEDFQEMTNLSKSLRERLVKECEIALPLLAEEQASKDGTFKWLFKLSDGNKIETVFIPERSRGTLCVSSQVGCMLNCEFCSTGKQGFNRNLSIAEIIGQVFMARKRLLQHASQSVKINSKNSENSEKSQNSLDSETVSNFSHTITNVVMMGMGEPLLNCEALFPALSIMRDELGFAFPRRRVTVSTAGVVPNIDRLSIEADVSLALSLHAPNDELRTRIVPLNKKYPLQQVLDACRRFVEKDPRRHVTMEYVMLKGVNDSEKEAKQLVRILQGINCKVNLIPFNPFSGADFERSDRETIIKFRDIVKRAGYITTIRKTRGEDIDAACGQLKGKIIDKTRRNEKFLLKVQKRDFDFRRDAGWQENASQPLV